MKKSVDLCSLSINNFHPHYSDIKTDNMEYTNQITPLQYFKDYISLVSNPHPILEEVTISDLEKIADQASILLHKFHNLESKLLLKGLPHLFSYIDFSKDDTQKLVQVLQQLHSDYPDKSFIQYSLTTLLILRDKITSEYKFLFYHLLFIPKFLLNHTLSVFLNEKSRLIEKCFILSTFIPSFEYDVPNLACPSDDYILPDPLHMINHLSEFTDEQIGYACHVMQLCHHYLISIIHTKEAKIEDFIPLLYLIGGSSFSRSCFSLAIYITSQIPPENCYIIQFVQKVQEFGCITFIEELFLFNTSESFSHIIPFSSNIFYQFFVENFERLTTEMKTVITSLSLDLIESAKHLNELSISTGNRAYLYWLYIFLTRLTSKQENDEIRIEIVKNYWTTIQSHIQKVYLLIESAEKFNDPSIDFLLNSTLYSIFKYCLLIVKRGPISDSLVNQIYDLISKSLHFIISTPVIIDKVTSLACELLKTYHCIQELIYKQPLFFKRCLSTFSDTDLVQSPIIALAMSNIHVPISFISKLANLLILSEEPTCFYCLSSLINNCVKLNELSIFLIQFFHNLVYVKAQKELQLQKKILMRYFLLVCSLMMSNDKFPEAFVQCAHFDAFNHLFKIIINEALISIDSKELQESIIFFLWALFRPFAISKNDDDEVGEESTFSHFEPYKIESFLKYVQYYSANCATFLLEAIIDFLTIFNFKHTSATSYYSNINRSLAVNSHWFIEIVNNLQRIKLDELQRSKIKESFSLPWKQNCIYSHLLKYSYWGAEFQKITKNKS